MKKNLFIKKFKKNLFPKKIFIRWDKCCFIKKKKFFKIKKLIVFANKYQLKKNLRFF